MARNVQWHVSKLHQVEAWAVDLFYPMQPQGIIKPKQKKKWFFILKRMSSDLLGIREPLTPVRPDKAEVNAEVEKARPVIQLDPVYNHDWGQEFVLWANRVIENYWPLRQATWPCLPLGSWRFPWSRTQWVYPSTARLKSEMVRAEQTRSGQQCREIYVPPQLKQLTGNWLQSSGSYPPDEWWICTRLPCCICTLQCCWQWCKEETEL